MTDIEAHVRNAIDEIARLRRENEILRAKVDTFELAGRLLSAQVPYFAVTMGEDIAWRLEGWLRDQEMSRKPGSTKAYPPSPPHPNPDPDFTF